MDAKDLRIETALGERNDGSKYSQSRVALQCNRNKSYQDIGSNPLAKAEVAVRPCAVIGPDRVVVPPDTNDTYLKKAVDLWPCSEYPKPLNNENPSRNISPRQTFQENMQRIMVPPNYSAVKHAEESNLIHVRDRNATLLKNSKQTMATEAKYCDVPYSVNLLANEHKNVREAEMCVPSVNSPLTRAAPHGWLPNGAMHALPRAYGPHDMYQYPQYPSCAGPGPSAVPMARHRTFQEDGSYGYPDSHYQDASVRFKPYPTVKERYPQARYDYVSNYPNPFHPPPPYAPHKYDIPNVRPPQPYTVYPHLKYLDNRVPDPSIEGYQRPNQQPISYNMQFRNQIIHPPYAPVLGNTQNKLPLYPPDKSTNKITLDTSKAYVDYENAKAKYSLPDNYFVSEMGRVHQVQKQVTMPNYASPGMQPVPLPQYHRKDHMVMKNYEYMPHYRHFEHPLGFNHSGHHQPQFSPSTLAISPTDSNTSNDTANTQSTSQEDCGYVSQSSTTSARSVDRLHNDYYRRYDHRYRPIVGNSQMLPKPEMTSSSSKENNKINVRQFLSMWSEGDEDNSNTKEITIPNNYSNQENAKSHDQLYVLGLVNVPSEELAKYEHIQKVSKLPENIKGYNSIELLNQFEEVIESSNINSFKTSTPKEYMPMKDRKNAIKQIVEVLPRPISPLDVEAKISQSVIHKEVGCNFEIKPCSPKMLNVEIAAPVQNILGERAIEKVSNPLSNKVKSPLSMRIDGNTACNTQLQDSTHSTYENISCKMIGSPFTANRMEAVKTNYSLQDLETSSGVCLASLPRLDNEIELSFPEVNQQFINANKVSRNFLETYPEEIKGDNQKLNSLTDDNENHNDPNRQTCISSDETCKENTKLSKFRINKLNSSEYKEDESNANAIRTDSVIIKNPENVRKNEDSKEKTSSLRSFGEEENTPINLTSQNCSHLDSESGTAAEYALDFSLNKSEDGLHLLNAFDDELINTAQNETLFSNVVSYNNDITENAIQHSNSSLKSSSERASIEPNTNSIIVRNNQSATNEYKMNLTDNSTSSLVKEKESSPQSLDRSDNNSINQKTSKITCVNVGNIIKETQRDSNETNTFKSSSTNVIVKHRHKNKSKSSKAKKNIISKCNSSKVPIVKKVNNKSHFNQHLNKNLLMPVYENNSNITQSVIQTHTLSGEHLKMESAVSNIREDENSETNSAVNNIISKSSFALNQNEVIVQDQINYDISVNNETDSCSKVINKVEDISKAYLTQKSLVIGIDREKENNSCLNIDKNEESDSTTTQIEKYVNNSIIVSEIITNKTSCEDSLQLSKNSFPYKENASVHIHNVLTEVDVSNAQGKNITNVDKTNNQVPENNKNLETVVDTSTMRRDVKFYDTSGIEDEYKKNSIANDELNLKSFDSEMFNDSNEEPTPGCEKTSGIENLLSDKIKIVDTETTDSKTSSIRKQLYADAKVKLDKKYSTDSGYQSSKNSFADNEDTNIEFPGNQTEDSVFIEHKSGISQITSREMFTINNSSNKEPPSPLSQNFISTSISIDLVNTSVNRNEHSANFDKQNIKTDKVELDDIDANMEMIFAQPCEEKLPESVNNPCINLNLETSNLFNPSETMEIDINSAHAVVKKNIMSSPTGIKDFMVYDHKPYAESLKKDGKDTKILNTLCFYEYVCHGKMLHSPWIQKLMMFNQGNVKSTFESIMHDTDISEKTVVNNFIQKVDIENSNGNITTKSTLTSKDLDIKSLQESKVESPMHDTDIDEKINIDNFIQNIDVKCSFGDMTMDSDIRDLDLKSPQESKINSPMHDTDNNKAEIDSFIHNVDVKSSICNISMNSALIGKDLDLKSLQESKVEIPMQGTDINDEINIDNFIQNVDAKSSIKDIITDSVIRGNDLDLKSLPDSKINSSKHDADIDNKADTDSFMHNVDVKSSIENSTLLRQDIELQSLIDSNITIIQSDESVKNACNESDVVILHDKSSSSTTENTLLNENIENKYTKILTIADKVENYAIEDKLLEISNVDSESKSHNTEDKSFEVQIISTVLKNNSLDYMPFNKTQSVVNDDNVVENILEKPIQTDFESLVQNEDVDNKAFRTAIIDNVSINEKIYTFDTKLVNYIEQIDTFDTLNFKENESLQNSHLKTDMKIDRVNPETNTNHFTNSSYDEITLNISMDLNNEIDTNSHQEKNDKISEDKNRVLCKDNKTEFKDVSGEESRNQNNLIESQEISFNYPNNSEISQITENVFNTNDNVIEFKCQKNIDEVDTKFNITNEHCAPIKRCRSLKRSLSDSALNRDVKEQLSDLRYSWASKRNRVNEFENDSLNNRRNSMNVEENVSFCILIDDNCIITEENEDKICIADLQEEYITEIDTGNDVENSDLLNGMDSSTHARGVDYPETVVLEYEDENAVQNTWVEDIACTEEVYSDEVAENVVISAPSSPSDSASDYEHEDIDIYGRTSCSHIDKVKLMHGDKMSEGDAQIVETLYRTPHMHIMNKTLLYGDKTVESDIDQDKILIESDDWKPSPTRTPDYIDPSNASNDFRLETPENKENVLVKDLSPLRRIDDYLDSSSADNETDEHSASHHASVSDNMAQDVNVYSCESSLDNVIDYKTKDEDESISTTTSRTSASSPEVSSTTTDDKNSGILLKITNLNGSRVSQINEIQMTNRPRCKFTEKKEYSTSNLNFPNRPLMTKAAQKYIPPIKESIRDLKVKITLPQQSLMKLKQLKLSRNEPKVHKQQREIPRIIKKPKPNFDDVLKSIDEIQIKRHKEKSKKIKTVVPKVLIKKNENGSHYASTPKKDIFSPDLTGRKWQPWVFLEKNHFIDKMAIKKKTKAMFSHRKNTYVLAEKFKKYKSVSSAKFVITQPKTPGQLKYTIRLKHSI